MASVHRLLAAALAGADDEHARGPFHLGGPPPQLGLADEIAAVMATVVPLAESLVDDARRPRFAEVIALARGPLDADSVRMLAARAQDCPEDDPLLGVARGVGIATAQTAVARPSHVKPTEPLVLAVVRFGAYLQASHPARYAALPPALDEELLRRELVTAAAPHGTLDRPVVLYRAAEGGKRVALWLARCADGRLALLRGRGKGRVFVVGAREEVMAHVPEEHFEAAVAALF